MSEARFHKGQPVSFRMGMREVNGIVKEDRGRIGVNGRRLYAVEYTGPLGSPNPSLIELPASELAMANDVVFEFDDLDALWDRIMDFKPNEHLLARRKGQGAQGAIDAIRADPRFGDYMTNVGKYWQPSQREDRTVFSISRKPKRKRSPFRAPRRNRLRLQS